MNIKFNKIHIENFLSLGEVELSLDNQGYVLVSGINSNPNDNAKSNGSGKSSIFEAIIWAITGETSRGIKDVVNLHGCDGALVELQFECDNNKYTLIRSKEHSKNKTNLRIYINDEDKSGKGIRDSEKLLSQYLPDLTPNLISSVIILGQGLPSRFTNNTPSGRKDLLEKLCRSDFMIEDLKERCNARKSLLSNDLRSCEDTLLTLTTKQGILKENRLRIDSDIKALEALHIDVDEMTNLQSKILELENKLLECQSQQVNYDKLLLDIRESINSSAQSYSDNIHVLDDKYKDTLTNLMNERNEVCITLRNLKDRLNYISNIKDVCPTCGQKIVGVVKPDVEPIIAEQSKYNETLSQLNASIKDVECTLDDEKEQYQNQYNVTKKDLLTRETELKDKLQSINKSIINYANECSALKSKLHDLESQSKRKEEDIARLKSELLDIDNSLASNDEKILYNINVKEDLNSRLTVISKFNTIITRDFRGYLLNNIISYLDAKAKDYCSKVFNTSLLNVYLDGNNISITYDNKFYESLSGGEKQKIDIILQLSLRDTLCNMVNFSSNLLALDEIFDNLDDIGTKQLIDFITSELTDISSVFIISHHSQELNIPYDQEIIICKDANGVSTIQL